MNITCNTQVLATELRLLSRIAPVKPSIPIFGHVLLAAEDALRLSATDLELALSTECAATIHETGYAALPAKPLLDILEQLPDADVNIADDRVVCGAFKSRLGSLPAGDFPLLPAPEGEPAVLPADALRTLVDRTAYAISEKTQKYVLDGALLSLVGEVMAMVATDGKRLSVATAARPAGPDSAQTVPSGALEMIRALAVAGEAEFWRGDRHLFFRFGKRLLVTRMLEGEYPKYQRIIPKANEHVLRIDRAALAAALRRVGLMSEAAYLDVSNPSIRVSARGADIGEAEELVPLRYEGPDIKLCANWRFLLDFLERATEATVSIALKDDATPLLLTDGPDFINVVMPMRV